MNFFFWLIQDSNALHPSRCICKDLKTETVFNLLTKPMNATAHFNVVCIGGNINTTTGNHPSACQIGVSFSLNASTQPQTGKRFVMRSFIGFVNLGLKSPLPQPKVLMYLMLETST